MQALTTCDSFKASVCPGSSASTLSSITVLEVSLPVNSVALLLVLERFLPSVQELHIQIGWLHDLKVIIERLNRDDQSLCWPRMKYLRASGISLWRDNQQVLLDFLRIRIRWMLALSGAPVELQVDVSSSVKIKFTKQESNAGAPITHPDQCITRMSECLLFCCRRPQ